MSKINHAPATYVQPDVLDESGVPLYGLDKELGESTIGWDSCRFRTRPTDRISGHSTLGTSIHLDRTFNDSSTMSSFLYPAAKRAAKFSPEREKQAREWIELLIGERFDESLTFQENLKDGTKLCRLINAIMPGAIPKVQSSNMPFRQMENINHFLTAIEKWGVPKFELFMTVDLYENKNIMQVIDCMFAVSRTAAKLGYQGPILGPKLAESRTINFTPEQLAEAKNVSLVGYNHRPFAFIDRF